MVPSGHKSSVDKTAWVDVTCNTHALTYHWKGQIDKLQVQQAMPVEQPAGFKPPPLGARPRTPQGRWTRAGAKSPAARPPPPAIPKEGVTSNHPLTERPPVPEIPHAIAPVTALREEIAFW